MDLRLKYVHRFIDRHGKPRHYYRRDGKRFPLPDPGPLSTPSVFFMEAYEEIDGGQRGAALERARKAPQWKGLIYVVGYDDYVKIGFTKDLRKRMSQLQTACPQRLHAHHTLPGTIANEQALHKSFAKSRLTNEWFRLSGPIADWIETQRPKWGLPGARSAPTSPSPFIGEPQ